MIENAADSHLSSAPKKIARDYFIREKPPSKAKVYSEAAGTQAVHRNGERLMRLPKCTMVSGQIDLKTGGERATPMRKLNTPK